jgi:hypothetical protein
MSKNSEPKKVFGITIGKAKPSVNSLLVVTAEERQNVSFVPTLPIVNVIPFGIVEKYQIKGLVRKFGLASIGIVAIFGLGALGVLGYISSQQSKIDALSAQQETLSQESEELAPYQAYNLSVDGKRTALEGVTGEDVNMGAIYENINSASTSSTITITTLSVAQNKAGEDASSCINPDPFASAESNVKIIGCVVLEGGGDNKDQVNGFLAELEGIGGDTPAYINPFISSFSTTSEPGEGARASNFSATIAFTSSLYTGKYSILNLTLKELIDNVKATNSTNTDGTKEIDLASSGIASIFANTLVGSLGASDAQNIDSIAYTSCTTDDTNTAEASLTLLIEASYPDVNSSTVVTQIMTEISDNCDAIVAEQEGN